MKNKIKAALQQGHKNLGITDEEVFERVASAAETFITDEAQIPEFVEKAGAMLKLYQSEADKTRTANKRISDLEAELKKSPKPTGNKDEDTPTPTPQSTDDIKKIIAEAVSATNAANKELIDSLQNKINAFESAQSAKEAIADAQSQYQSNEYVKGFSDEANDAWEHALEINEERGGKMTSKELLEKAMGYFKKAVAKRGVDTSKPFEGTGDESKFDVNKYRKALENTGRIKKEE